MMSAEKAYLLGQSEQAARRLRIQDAHFAAVSEKLLDEVGLKPDDRVVELGCGPGGLSGRILQRLGPGGILVGVDASSGLLAQAEKILNDSRFQPVQADLATLGPWLQGANAILGRTVLHHVPMVEFVLGRLRASIPAGTRIGLLEPDFRTPLTRLAYLETSRPELAPLRIWAIAINQLYQLNRISPDVGATLARTLEMAGYTNVRSGWSECRSDEMMIDNMLMFYDEVQARLDALGILSLQEVDQQRTLLRSLDPSSLPAVWGIYWVACLS